MRQQAFLFFTDTHLTILGLLIFFIFFVLMVLRVFRGSAREHYEQMAQIPLGEGEINE